MKNCFSLLFGCLLVLVFSSLAQAQQKISVVDSLEKALSKNDTLRVRQLKTGYDKSDSERVKILYGLCYELTKISSYKKARQYGELALDIAKQIGFKTGEDRGDYYLGVLCYYQRRTDDALKYLQQAFLLEESIGDKKIISSTYLMLGLVQVNQSNYADAMKNFELGLKLKIAINDKSGIATAYHNMGIVHYYKGDYPTALENYLKALKIREEINEKRGIAMSSNNISIIYEKQGNLKDALQNYNLALSQFKELGDKKGIASCYNNMATIYEKQGNYAEALESYGKALEIKEEIGDKKGITVTHFDIGSIYYNQGNYDEALKHNLAALKIDNEIDDNEGKANHLGFIGDILLQQKKYKESRVNIEEALRLGKENDVKTVLKDGYRNLSELDTVAGDWKSAYEHYNLFILYRDSLFGTENDRKIAESKIQYEFDKKEAAAKLEQQQKELAYQKELALKALQYEYQKKQSAAKSEEEKQKIRYEQQIKEQQISYKYAQKITKVEAEKQSQLALNKVLSSKNSLIQQNNEKEKKIVWLMVGAVILLVAFGINYYRSYKRQQANNKVIMKQSNELQVLMQEIHHRVKNNLQLISSLLELQSMKLTDGAAKSAFEEGQSRVQSIAILHQQLYQHENVSMIELGTFCKELIRQITSVFKKPNQKVTQNINMPETFFDIDTALPIGLILNELATNSFKYAHPPLNKEGMEELLLDVRLYKDKEGHYCLIYKDNGIGLPVGTDIAQMQSLGLRIVNRLVKQMKGQYRYEYANGAVFTIEFPGSA